MSIPTPDRCALVSTEAGRPLPLALLELAEGEGVEPLTLLRCHPGFRDRLPASQRHPPYW